MLQGRWIKAVSFSLMVFLIYLKTLCPSIRFWDSAELTAAAYFLGIPHAPGFPLYILIGRVFVSAGILSPEVAVNLLSAISAGGAIFIALIIFQELSAGKETWGGYFCVTLMALGSSVWMQAVRAEVYALNLLLIELALYLMLFFQKSGNWRYFYAGWYFWSLSVVTHTVSAFSAFIPLLIIGLGSKNKKKLELCQILPALFFFSMAISIYIYLPVRSALHPAINWGRTTDIKSLWSMISAHEFAYTINIESLHTLFERLAINFKILYANIPVLISFFALLGLIIWRKKLFLIMLFLFGITIIVMRAGLPYPDHLGYLCLVVFALSIWAGAGFDGVCSFFYRKRFITDRGWMVKTVAGFLLLLMLLTFFLVQYPRNNLYKNYWAVKLGEDILKPLPASSIVLFNDISSYFICRYLQTVKNLRSDCNLVIPGFLNSKSASRIWYREELKERTSIKGLDNLPGEETAIVARILEKNHRQHPIFCEYGEDYRPFAHYLKPRGLLFRVVLPEEEEDLETPQYHFPLRSQLQNDREAALAFGERLYAQGIYYSDMGDETKSKELFYQAYILTGEEINYAR